MDVQYMDVQYMYRHHLAMGRGWIFELSKTHSRDTSAVDKTGNQRTASGKDT